MNIHYTPSHIANFFLSKKNHKISNLALNKLVYITEGFSLAKHRKDLFAEDIEAWTYGPVIPSLYHEFKFYGSNPIKSFSNVFFEGSKKKYPTINKNDKDLQNILDIVWGCYYSKEGGDFIELTHKEGTPWSSVYKKDHKGIIIPKTIIEIYYKGFLGL